MSGPSHHDSWSGGSLIKLRDLPGPLFAQTAPDQKGSGRAHHRSTASTRIGPLGPCPVPMESDMSRPLTGVTRTLTTLT